MRPGDARPLGLARRVALSAFIAFHWAAVFAWLCPNPSPLKNRLLDLALPLPTERGTRKWHWEEQSVAAWYLFNTAQFQDWAMFAPNPLQANRYVAADIVRRDGTVTPFVFPRLCQMNVFEAWAEKRYRKYQHRITDENVPAFREDLARYLARRFDSPGNPPARVVVKLYESPIPRHDRPEARAGGRFDYGRLLRTEATYACTVLADYSVRPEDLRD